MADFAHPPKPLRGWNTLAAVSVGVPLHCWNYCNHKDFKDIERQDVISFLDSLRKTEIADPLHKWIGTYNVYQVHLVRFIKWLYFPN
jgi:hypothetical protein